MNRFYGSLYVSLLVATAVAQEKMPQDTLSGGEVALREVFVTGLRAYAQTPVTFSNIAQKDIAPRNLGQDIPILLNYLPGVVSTSDAGAGVGYTGIRVRGSDATRINVTINGVPYNDAESQGTFWVNLPDFASSTESLQLQRGVGTSTNGAGAFGASLHLLTHSVNEQPFAEITNTFGSFNTRKHSASFSTGKLNNALELAGRLSAIASDGYIDRAFSDLTSYFLQAAYQTENTSLKALLFGGREITYQAWNGIDAETLQTDRTFNPSGMYTDPDGTVRFYHNEVDNYRQDHFQLHWDRALNARWATRLTAHYTYGKGFFEQYREDESFEAYGLTPLVIGDEVIGTTDLVRKRWLDNDFYGMMVSAEYRGKILQAWLGTGWNAYDGAHFGEVIWARYAGDSEINSRYYDGDGDKTDAHTYAKITYQPNQRWNLFGDLQLRTVHYKATGPQFLPVSDTFLFFNPKAGFTYQLTNQSRLYLSYAVAHREPNRTDYENGTPQPERLHDLEAGWRYAAKATQLNVNLYYMNYTNQLTLTGQLDDVGNPIRANTGKSYRLGLELDGALDFSDKWSLKPNAAFSLNQNRDFVQFQNGIPQNLGNTPISYSPGMVAANLLTYRPFPSFQASFLSKYVGGQYMGNTGAEASKLNAYFVNDLNLQYQWKPRAIVSSITLTALVNNLFNARYVSNGYYYTFEVENEDGTVSTLDGAGYYPQAGIHFLAGVTARF